VRISRAPLLPVVLAGLLLAGVAGCDAVHGVISGDGTLKSHGGSVYAQCIDHTRVKIVSADPAAGFTAHIVVQGPANQASLIFENPKANDFRVAISCENYVPVMQEFEIEDTTVDKSK
jgi:hypothetical protein